ncbi:nucleotidyltransferase [Pectobacterium phage Clickz]|uniref:Poly A polymerase head domain-containing protein n=8 Tax=Phimunavirus Clickz TaxID=2733338 RepID=A0A3G8FH44_9CAUD|nr:nucleotidyltransferase [Pectobacterium phage Clickz]AZF94117.1 hypothetical protein [Pectobacterium phage Clickz_B2]AZF94190.1 hypothetical protein [Pectobacterium phage Clickz_B3]AZF94241.1 hypothetical protein [Pectobacterium phage Clickz_B4]AZF94278.1 hypothetical protein [Pectobacterium phage Clickz_B5]AZF94343.1 hypothetical protein [Pectobacterium phage Clickz_B6]AZF94374.1 hypothetical protein [Pectobacterium phage Clickz_B7]AZF94458.1 hypothetical protein [Pectobacterium phage Cli
MYLTDLRGIQQQIRTITGYDFVLAGGCVRDVLHGKEPKDFDAVLCLGTDDYAYAFAMVTDISAALSFMGWKSACYIAYGVNTGSEIAPGAFEETFLACMKTTSPDGLDIDLLFSRKPHIGDHCILHDCNVNMVWLDETKVDGYGGVRLPASKLEFRPGINSERVKYMKNKMSTYGY